MTFKKLADESKTYRAAAYSTWVDKKGHVKWQAFKRAAKDSTGVSVAFTPENAELQMGDPIHGMAEVSTGGVRECTYEEIALDVEQDALDHAEIKNLPFVHTMAEGSPERQNAESIVEVLCKEIRAKAARSIPYQSVKDETLVFAPSE